MQIELKWEMLNFWRKQCCCRGLHYWSM